MAGKRAMKLLFLGGMFPKEMEDDICKKSSGVVQNAANVLQWNIIKGLRQCKDIELTIVSALFVGSWPQRYQNWNIHQEKCNGVELIAFKNFPVYKNISRYIHVYRYLCRWIQNNESSGQQLCIMAYSAHTPFIKALYRIKKEYSVCVHVIVPDLPEYMNLGKKSNVLFHTLKMVDMYIQERCLSRIDSFTFLTQYMSDKFNSYNKPYVVVEGMVDPQVVKDFSKGEFAETEELRIVYTGTMNIRYGVMNLVRAMSYIEESNVKLILCGTGDGEKEILEAAERDERIMYCGQVSRSEALEMQRKATILVNPRSGDEEYTKYSFPSKNLEYMLHNKPVIVFKLTGIPDEYDQVLNYFHENDPEQMAEDMMRICTLQPEEREKMGGQTTQFVLNEKNYIVQTRKILSVCEKYWFA